MNTEDLALFQQAEALANGYQTRAAYRLFCQLENRGNKEIELAFWLIQTTPWPQEARTLLTWIEQEVPDHPALERARTYIYNKWHGAVIARPAPTGPTLQCPYCGTLGPTPMSSRVSTTGWVVFVALLIFCFPLCWIGLLFQQKYCTCSRCSAEIQKL